MLRAIRYTALLGWSVLCLGPLYWLAVTSLKDPHALLYGPVYVPFLDFQPTLEAWRTILFEEIEIPRRFLNTVAISLSATALTMVMAVLAAQGAARFRSTERIVAGLLVTRLVPPAMLVIPLYVALSRTGFIDTRTALALVYSAVNLPVAIWLLRPLFGRATRDIEDAAQLDGASQVRILADILVPLLARPIAAVAVLILVLCWNEYLLAAFLTANQAQTMPPYLAGVMSIREQQAASDPEEISRLAAATLLMVAPLIPAIGFVQRALRVPVSG